MLLTGSLDVATQLPGLSFGPRALRAASAVLAVLALLAGACASAESPSTTFRSAEYGYAIGLPEGWTTVRASARLEDGEPPATADGKTDILGPGASTKVSQMGLPALVIGAQPVAAGTGPTQWADAVTKTVAFMKGCAETGSRFPLTIGGRPAEVLVYEDCPEGSSLTHLWATVVEGDLGFHIVWFDRAGELHEQKAALRALLASFSFE